VVPLGTDLLQRFFIGRPSGSVTVTPRDWHLEVTLSCTCPDCADLQTFARDPKEQVHRFRINKERRRHLHEVIKRYSLDMTHVTARVGSPQTLVCTKDRRTFQARMLLLRHELANLLG
jgi:hypothetical protein